MCKSREQKQSKDLLGNTRNGLYYRERNIRY